MAKSWKVVGVEEFKGQKYIKMEVEGDTSTVFGKKHANISEGQMKAIFGAMEVADVLEFAGVTPDAV